MESRKIGKRLLELQRGDGESRYQISGSENGRGLIVKAVLGNLLGLKSDGIKEIHIQKSSI